MAREHAGGRQVVARAEVREGGELLWGGSLRHGGRAVGPAVVRAKVEMAVAGAGDALQRLFKGGAARDERPRHAADDGPWG